jgi:hypothetical protein
MIKSPAWRVLSLSARRVLDRIEIELADHGGTDNGKLPVTYDDFVRYGIDRHAVAPAIREVEALGFIEMTEHGRAGNADFRSPNKFRLTYRPMGRAPTTDEWRRITTEEMAAKIKNQCRKTPSFSVGNRHRKRKFHSAATHTTGHGGETPTNLDISGRDGRRDILSGITDQRQRLNDLSTRLAVFAPKCVVRRAATLFECQLKIGSLGVAALGCDPLKDGDVLVVEADWKNALRSRQRHHNRRMSDRRCERRKIGTNVVSVRPH